MRLYLLSVKINAKINKTNVVFRFFFVISTSQSSSKSERKYNKSISKALMQRKLHVFLFKVFIIKKNNKRPLKISVQACEHSCIMRLHYGLMSYQDPPHPD